MKPAAAWRGLAATAAANAGVEGERIERGAQVGTVEVARREPGLGGDHPVGRGDDVVAGHRLQHLAEVDDERVAGAVGTSIHSPSGFSTCSPPTPCCISRVRNPASWWALTPASPGGVGG